MESKRRDSDGPLDDFSIALKSKQPDFDELLDAFWIAYSVIDCVVHAYDGKDDHTSETTVLRIDMKMLKEVINRFDLAIPATRARG